MLCRLEESFDHRGEVCLILGTNSLELQPKSTPSLNVTHRGIGPDFSILDEKMKLNRGVDGANLACLDKKTTDAQIFNPRRIFRSAAPPEHPHALGRFDSLVVSS